MGIDKDRLYVTVFEGDDSEGLAFDQEAYDEWKNISEDRILKETRKITSGRWAIPDPAALVQRSM